MEDCTGAATVVTESALLLVLLMRVERAMMVVLVDRVMVGLAVASGIF